MNGPGFRPPTIRIDGTHKQELEKPKVLHAVAVCAVDQSRETHHEKIPVGGSDKSYPHPVKSPPPSAAKPAQSSTAVVRVAQLGHTGQAHTCSHIRQSTPVSWHSLVLR